MGKRRSAPPTPQQAAVSSGNAAQKVLRQQLQSESARRPAAWRRKAARLAVMVIVPAVVLACLELVLRLAGFGYPTKFFIKADPAGQTLTTNRKFAWQFMPRSVATQPYPLLIRPEKTPGTIRVFVLGESAAQGTPAPAFGFPRILEAMLQQQFPGKPVEVISVAMRGINSHVVLPIARECLRYQPDLFIVYMGNNEAIGLYSPEAGSFPWARYRRLLGAVQWIKATKLGQFAETLITRLGKSSYRPEQTMDLFRKGCLLQDDPRRQPVYDNFQANLAGICRAAQRAGVKVVLSTVAVNLKDFPPLVSMHQPGLRQDQLAAWQAAYTRGTNVEAQGLAGEAIEPYLQAERLDDHFAELHFRLGRCYLALGKTEQAAGQFRQACDWDALQFRTDTRLNQVTRHIAAAGAGRGLWLVDAEIAFARQADHQLPDSKFFYEHVHLTFDGDYLLARTVLPVVAEALGLQASGANPSAAPPILSRAECAVALGFSEWDEISVHAAMIRSTAKPPFLEQLEHAPRLAKAQADSQARVDAFQRANRFPASVEVYRAALARRPDDWQLHFNYGCMLTDFGNHSGAAAEFAAAVRLMPVYIQMRMMLSQALNRVGRPVEARVQLDEILRLEPDYAPAREALGHFAK